MRKIWLTTDTHFNHPALQEYSGRPKDADDLIRDNLRVVNKDDLLIHLGDVCIGEDKVHNNWFKTLGCRTILIKGNHDGKSNNWYMDNGWDLCAERFDFVRGGKLIAFTHQPIQCDKYFALNIHGHFHNNLGRLLEGRYVVDGEEERNKEDLANLTDKHILIALEETDYKPVLLDKILSE